MVYEGVPLRLPAHYTVTVAVYGLLLVPLGCCQFTTWFTGWFSYGLVQFTLV